ncbi:L-asparaginase [Sardina pilchardus]|uniref:L-asparaginase n=1 Tax=Sardina pilchardus TaxID=27697 RepID=UPI002E15D617
MGIISARFTREAVDDEQYKFWSAVASSLRLGWLGTDDKERELRVCQLALFPMLMNASALQGDIVSLQSHLNEGADVCVPDNRGRTPLHLASGEGDVETVKYLISKGADVNARDNSGGTALMDAIRFKNFEAVKYLVCEGATLEMSELEIGAEMCCLAYLGHTDQMEAWKLAGVSLNWTDLDGRTPLHVAVCTNQEDVVRYCLKNGSNIELRDRFNNRPVDDAQRLGLKNLLRLLYIKAKRLQESASRDVTEAEEEDSDVDELASEEV